MSTTPCRFFKRDTEILVCESKVLQGETFNPNVAKAGGLQSQDVKGEAVITTAIP